MSTSENLANAALIAQVLLTYQAKITEALTLFQQAAAEGRDVTDAEVEASSLKRDVELEKARKAVEGMPGN
jgi:hypothetical protein